jgi:hypothetical protein
MSYPEDGESTSSRQADVVVSSLTAILMKEQTMCEALVDSIQRPKPPWSGNPSSAGRIQLEDRLPERWLDHLNTVE